MSSTKSDSSISDIETTTTDSSSYDIDTTFSDTDYHVDLLHNSIKLKEPFEVPILSDSTASSTVIKQKKISIKNDMLKNYDISNFNLKKYIKTGILNFLISSNLSENILIFKILNALKEQNKLPKHILVINNLNLKKNIKNKFYENKVHFYNPNTVLTTRLEKILLNSFIICDDISFYFNKLKNIKKNIVVLSDNFDDKYTKYFNISMCNLGFSYNNFLKKYISDDKYFKIRDKYNNRVFIVIDNIKNIKWYSINKYMQYVNTNNIENETENNINPKQTELTNNSLIESIKMSQYFKRIMDSDSKSTTSMQSTSTNNNSIEPPQNNLDNFCNKKQINIDDECDKKNKKFVMLELGSDIKLSIYF